MLLFTREKKCVAFYQSIKSSILHNQFKKITHFDSYGAHEVTWKNKIKKIPNDCGAGFKRESNIFFPSMSSYGLCRFNLTLKKTIIQTCTKKKTWAYDKSNTKITIKSL